MKSCFFFILNWRSTFKFNLLCLFMTIFCFLFYFIFMFFFFIEFNTFFFVFDIFYFEYLLKTLYKTLSCFCIEIFIFFNILLTLSFRVKMFLRLDFWSVKIFQKNEIFFLKSLVFFLITYLIFNFFVLYFNLHIVSLSFEGTNFILEFKKTIFFVTNKELFLNTFSNVFYKDLVLFFFIFVILMYLKDLTYLYTNTYKNVFIFYILLNFLLLFSVFFVSCFDFFIFFILLIGINICTYTLLIFDNNTKNAREASIKYFMSSSVGTLFILGGVCLIFLMYKTTNFFILHTIITQNHFSLLEEKLRVLNKVMFFFSDITNIPFNFIFNIENIVSLNSIILHFNNFLILIFLLVGLTFKLALFPLHSWSVEVYSAIKYRLISIFVLILKLIFFVKICQIFFFVFQLHIEINFFINNVVLYISVLSIIYGSFAALFEDKLKKIIAFSSISQFGFIFLSLSVSFMCTHRILNNYWNYIECLQAAIFFILIYLFSNLILFWFLHRSSKVKEVLYIKDLNNIPLVFLIPILISILSFTGLPPLAGFFSKFFVLFICWKNGFVFFSFVGLISSIFSNYYYLKILKISIFDSCNLILKKNNIQYKKKRNCSNFVIDLFVFLLVCYIIFFFVILKQILKLSLLLSINMLFFI